MSLKSWTLSRLTWRTGALAALGLVACSTPRITALPAPESARSATPEPVDLPRPDAASLRAPAGYRIEAVVTGLTYPTSVELDDRGNLYIAEAGWALGDPYAQPRILRVAPDGEVRLLTDRLVGPVTDLLWRDGRLYVSHRGRISAVDADGAVHDLVTGLPSWGEHSNSQLTVGPDRKLYFGQGTVTNSGVVGIDDFLEGWLALCPDAHDRPARDVRLVDRAYRTVNPFLVAGGEGPYTVTTKPFAAFGAEVIDDDDREGITVLADERPSGCIYRCNTDGTELEVYAWGLANPAGVLWNNDGQLYAAIDGMAERGSRPIANAPDELSLIKQNGWYGWPDYASGLPVTERRFEPSYGDAPEPLMLKHPPVEQPLLTFPTFSGVSKLACPRHPRWGDPRTIFMAMTGDPLPGIGPHIARAPELGPRIVRIDPTNRRVETFVAGLDEGVVDQGLGAGPRNSAGLRRPVDVAFSQTGDAMYVADLGIIQAMSTRLPSVRPFPGSGVVWRIVPVDVQRVAPPAGLSIGPPRVEATPASK